MKRIGAVAALFIAGMLLAYSSNIVSGFNDNVTWTKYSDNPLNLGVARAIEPYVIYEGNVFKMWYTAITDAHRIYYATSSDGINWTPYGVVLDVGPAGSWDSNSVERPVVLFDGTIYRMWYSGYIPLQERVGYANSTDGIHWTKYGGNPVLVPGPSGAWDSADLGYFTVVSNGTSYIMWYDGYSGGQGSPLKIGVATSVDGISWTKYQGNPVIVPGSSDWEGYHVYPGPVLNHDGGYEMWYSGENYSGNVRIGTATSPDGLVWTKNANNPVLDIGSAGSWDSAYVIASAIVEEDNTLMIWYWGSPNQSGGSEGTGLATANIPVSWEYEFIDTKRGTVLKINTDEQLFQFIAPRKDFGIKHDPKMKVFNDFITIYYQDSQLSLNAIAMDGRNGFCTAVVLDKQTGMVYLLIEIPKWLFHCRAVENPFE